MTKPKIVSGNPYHATDLGLNDEDGVVWGVFVGACIDERVAWGIWEDAAAHAHNDTKDPWFGWICIIEPKDVLTPTGRPTSTLIHEYAHILCPNSGHGVAWKKKVTELGAKREIKRIERIKEKNKIALSKQKR